MSAKAVGKWIKSKDLIKYLDMSAVICCSSIKLLLAFRSKNWAGRLLLIVVVFLYIALRLLYPAKFRSQVRLYTFSRKLIGLASGALGLLHGAMLPRSEARGPRDISLVLIVRCG